jgi:hypothetical protein
MATNSTPRFFNSTFEAEMRVLLILSETTVWPLSNDSLAYIDFMAVYGKDYGVSHDNLHGNNQYRLGEITSRIELIGLAIPELVKSDFIEAVDGGEDFLYQITDSGELFIDKVEDTYSEEYRDAIRNIVKKFNVIDSKNLRKIIFEKSTSTERGKL